MCGSWHHNATALTYGKNESYIRYLNSVSVIIKNEKERTEVIDLAT